MKKKKLFKITNSAYFQVRQLQGQLNYFSAYFDVIAVAPKGEGWEELQNSGNNVKSHKSDFLFNNSFPIGKTFYQREADYCSLAHPQSWSFGYVSSMDSTCADPYAHGNRLPIDDGYGHKKTNSSFYGTVNLRLCHKCISQFTKDV